MQGTSGAAPEAPASPRPLDPAKIAEALVIGRWRAAEDRIYPLMMADTDLYQLAVTAVASVVAQVRELGLTRAQLLTIDVEATTSRALADPTIQTNVSALTSGAGLTPLVVVEAALAQVIALQPPDQSDPPTPVQGAAR